MVKKITESQIEIQLDTKKKMLTLFVLFFPSVLVALIPNNFLGSGIWESLVPISIKALLLFYQFVVIKNFIDTHYGD